MALWYPLLVSCGLLKLKLHIWDETATVMDWWVREIEVEAEDCRVHRHHILNRAIIHSGDWWKVWQILHAVFLSKWDVPKYQIPNLNHSMMPWFPNASMAPSNSPSWHFLMVKFYYWSLYYFLKKNYSFTFICEILVSLQNDFVESKYFPLNLLVIYC